MHELSARGFSRGADAYERSRPDYPAKAVALLVRELRIGPASVVADVGAGTGRFTRMLRDSGAWLIAIEPLAEMREKLARAVPDVAAVGATAEALPLRDASLDAILCAQSFHWFEATAALAEFARVLRLGGAVGLIWNTRDDRVAWVRAFDEIVNRRGAAGSQRELGDLLRAGRSLRPAPARGLRARAALDPQGRRRSPRSPSCRRRSAARCSTRWRWLVRDHPETRDRDEIVLPYRTAVYWTVRRP